MRSVLLFPLVVVVAALCQAAEAKPHCPKGGCLRQYYSAWTFNPKLNQYERFYCYLPKANSPKYDYLHVVYAPRNGDKYAYYYDPARQDFVFRVAVVDVSAAIPLPDAGVWEVKGPDGNWQPSLVGPTAPIDTGEPFAQLPGDFVPDPNFGR